MSDIQTFVQDYIAVWNEPDAGRRRQLIRTLWQEDAHHLARTLEAVVEPDNAAAVKFYREQGFAEAAPGIVQLVLPQQ